MRGRAPLDERRERRDADVVGRRVQRAQGLAEPGDAEPRPRRPGERLERRRVAGLDALEGRRRDPLDDARADAVDRGIARAQAEALRARRAGDERRRDVRGVHELAHALRVRAQRARERDLGALDEALRHAGRRPEPPRAQRGSPRLELDVEQAAREDVQAAHDATHEHDLPVGDGVERAERGVAAQIVVRARHAQQQIAHRLEPVPSEAPRRHGPGPRQAAQRPVERRPARKLRGRGCHG